MEVLAVAKSVFLISPVRKLDAETEELLSHLVDYAERNGDVVHWPKIDTDQSGNGTAICQQNRQAIINADEVWLWWQADSQGSLFDLGIAWGLKKPLKIISGDLKYTEEKSFDNVLLDWHVDGPTPND